MSVAYRNPAIAYLPIPGFPKYEAGSDGTIWKVLKPTTKNRHLQAWRLLRGTVDKDGYRYVILRNDAGGFGRRVHRLILLAFCGSCPSGMEGRHLNGIRDDNRLDNLLWDTHISNIADKQLHGTALNGERHHKAKLRESDVKAMREQIDAGMTITEAAKSYGISKSNAFAIKKRKIWRHVR